MSSTIEFWVEEQRCDILLNYLMVRESAMQKVIGGVGAEEEEG
jgi:hypothetical protein